MNDDNFFSIERLVEFGLGMGIAQQMVQSMNQALQNVYVPGTMNPVQGPLRTTSVFFVVLDGKQAGPLTEAEMTRLIADGQVTKETYVWKAGMRDWARCDSVPEVLRLVALCPPPFKPEV